MRRTALALLVVAAFGGVTGYAQLRTDGPPMNRPVTIVGVSTSHLPEGVGVTADRMETKPLGPNAPAPGIESISFQGHVTVNQDGAIVRADEATYNPATHELQLSGNVRMVLPDPAPSAK